MRLRLHALCLIAGAFAVHGAAWGQEKIPALEDVPEALPEPPRAGLAERRRQLGNAQQLLLSRVKDFNARCRLYSTSSPEARICPDEKPRIYADVSAHAAAVKSFNWDLEQAIGEYQNRLEKRLGELDAGLQRDAAALRQMGFARRAEDFADWTKLSTEAHRITFVKVMQTLVDEGGDQVVKSTLMRVRALHASRLGPLEARQLLAEMQAKGLQNTNAQAYLRTIIDKGLTKEAARAAAELAEQLQKDARLLLDPLLVERNSSDLEKATKLVQMALPPHMSSAVTIGELAIYLGYDIRLQTVAAREVKRLTELTERDLKSLQAIACLSQRRMVEKHDVGAKLAALHERSFDQPKPFVSSQCTGGRT